MAVNPPSATRGAFIYLLNAFEQASQSDNPSLLDYARKRQALLDYVAKLETVPSETACREQIDFAIEKEACRWAERLNWIHAKYDVDGSGTESGDALDVIEAEIRLALGKLEEQTTPSAIRCKQCGHQEVE